MKMNWWNRPPVTEYSFERRYSISPVELETILKGTLKLTRYNIPVSIILVFVLLLR